MVNNDLKISVIMATYNGEKYIEQQIASIVNQSHRPYEIIIVDDKSNDNTIEIVKKYINVVNLKFFVNERNVGVLKTFLRAANAVSIDTNYIAFADQDDVWFEGKLKSSLQKMLEIEQTHLPALVFTDMKLADEDLFIINESFWQHLRLTPQNYSFHSLFVRNFVTGCTMLINKPMFEYFLAVPENVYLHDAWIAYIAYYVGTVGFVNVPTMLYRQHHNNVTYSITEMNQRRDIVKRMIKGVGTIINNSLMIDQLKLAQIFYQIFYLKGNINDREMLTKFIAMHKCGYLKKKRFAKSIINKERNQSMS